MLLKTTLEKCGMIAEGLQASGVPEAQADAVAKALFHGCNCSDFVMHYGTAARDRLKEFINTAAAEVAATV